MNNDPKLGTIPKGDEGRHAVRAESFQCEWCGTPMKKIRAIGQTDPGVRQALGWCEKCNAQTWSKPIKILQ